jgi:hypothetical protein
MTRINRLILPLSFLTAATFSGAIMAQDTPAPQPPATPPTREAMMARRQVMQRLTADFRSAIQNGSLAADDRQKAEAALAQIQPQTKATRGSGDPKARHAAMALVQQMSASAALRGEDRQLLVKDLADLKALRHPRS